MRGLMARAGRRIGAEAAGALQVDRLGVEQPAQHHHPVHAQQFGSILGECRQLALWRPIGVKHLLIANGKLRDGLQPRLPFKVLVLFNRVKVSGSAHRSLPNA